MRDFDEMKLARVIDACGGVDGRVKLQKIVYLLKSMGYDLPFDDFWIRQYGPYSRAIACCVDSLSSAGFVEESQADLSIVNPDGGQARQYSYRVRDSIRAILRQYFEIPAPMGKPPIETVAMKLRDVDRAPLEVAATKLFLEKEDGLTGAKLDAELQRLKRHLREHFDKADELLLDWNKRGCL